MTDILIRDIDGDLVKALSLQATKNNRSLEAEIKAILQTAVTKPLKKRSLADALLEIPKLDDDADVDKLFERPGSTAIK